MEACLVLSRNTSDRQQYCHDDVLLPINSIINCISYILMININTSDWQHRELESYSFKSITDLFVTLAVSCIILTHWCYSSFMKSRQHSSCPHLERKIACIINCKMLSRYSQGRHMHASNWWKCKVMTYPLLNVCLWMSYSFFIRTYNQMIRVVGPCWTIIIYMDQAAYR